MQAIVTQPQDSGVPVRFQKWSDPRINAGHVLVRVRRAALNRNDAMLVDRRADLGGPRVLGSDGAGTVVEVGSGVLEAAPGDDVVILPSLRWGPREDAQGPDFEILGYPTAGTHAEYILVPEENVFVKPPELEWDEAAALPLAGLTAWRALITRGGLKEGERVLVTGAAGGVASYLVQIAAALGAQVWVTSGREDAIRTAVKLGAVGGVVRSGDWPGELAASTGGPFDLVVDSAGASWDALVGLLRPGGRMVVLGRTADHGATLDVHGVFWSQVSILGSSMGGPREFADLLSHVAKHDWRPVVDRVIPMSEPVEAYRALNDPGRFGKVVLSAPDS
ncbi:zinc-binding dehydrogenase [Nocardiopsis sp. EMB25]|uniref:zinc-binding dehydrogenase n=1 Tax=Nocardiopsis TaxID=2013 RepID=UPI000349C207|nr:MULTISPECIES: zinc-binding dehydrogenase [Nocardiopsis]MCY9786119.1 zinc-binding dehydrogenase [Nocardiopsis sp. EMB25]